MSVHTCPWCRCAPARHRPRLVVNTRAEFWPLVVAIDRLLYPNYGRRSA